MSTPGRDRTNRPPSRRCVNCSLRLAPNLRKRPIADLDEQMLILLRSWVSPTPVSSDDILCIECFLLLRDRILSNTPTSQIEVSPPLGHLNVCFGCGMSIASGKTHRVSQDCPQRTFILKWTPAHHVIHLERVCRACWEAATRDIQRRALPNIKPKLEYSENNEVDILDAVVPAPPPLPLPVPPPQGQQLPQPVLKINSLKYKRVSASSRHCLFVGCRNTSRLLVPGTIKEVLLLQYKIYIPFTARICKYHLHSNRWNELEPPYSDFTGLQVDDIFSKLEKAAERQLDSMARSRYKLNGKIENSQLSEFIQREHINKSDFPKH